MKTFLITPTKSQLLICSLTVFLFLRLLSTTEFLTSEKYSNRQYSIFGILTLAAFAISITAVMLYRAKKSGEA
ncbi:MAG: hypothetical protein J0L67_12635 [Cytophagales bacterium]|nr:hypothetical protein [Cytophagales bacterium]